MVSIYKSPFIDKRAYTVYCLSTRAQAAESFKQVHIQSLKKSLLSDYYVPETVNKVTYDFK